MEFINVLDEHGRFIELKIYNNGKDIQRDSHTESYLWRREDLKKDFGGVIGLDYLVEWLRDYLE